MARAWSDTNAWALEGRPGLMLTLGVGQRFGLGFGFRLGLG